MDRSIIASFRVIQKDFPSFLKCPYADFEMKASYAAKGGSRNAQSLNNKKGKGNYLVYAVVYLMLLTTIAMIVVVKQLPSVSCQLKSSVLSILTVFFSCSPKIAAT